MFEALIKEKFGPFKNEAKQKDGVFIMLEI